VLALLLLALALPGTLRAAPTITHCDARGVTVVFEFGALSLREVAVPGVPGRIAELPDCINYQIPGMPDLPQLRVMLGVAQEGSVSLSVLPGDIEEIRDCELAPGPAFDNEGRAEYEKSPAFDQPGCYPSELVRVEAVELLRDVRVARLLVSPVQYDPLRRVVRVHHSVTVRLDFEKPAQNSEPGSGGRGQASVDPFDALYPRVLLNGEQAREWRVGGQGSGARGQGSAFGGQGAGAAGLTRSSFFDRSNTWLKIRVESTGVYRVGYDDLKRLGIDAGLIDPRTLQLFTTADHAPNTEVPDTMTEVALKVMGESDSVFRPQDYFMFYGRSPSYWNRARDTFTRNLYTPYNCYWLTWGAAAGRRMVQGIGAPVPGEPVENTGFAKVRVEQERDCPARSGLLWIWNIINKVEGEPSAGMDCDLGLGRPVRVRSIAGRFFSTVNSNNHLVMSLNHALLDSFDFANRPYYNPFEFDLRYDSQPCPGLDSATSVLNLELRGNDKMQAYVDYFDVTYEFRLRLVRAGGLPFSSYGPGWRAFRVDNVRSEPIVLNVDRPHAPRLITEWQRAGDWVQFRDFVAETSDYVVTDAGCLLRPASMERRSPGRLARGSFSADYLIVAPDNLFEAAQALERYRTGNIAGLTSATVRTVRLSEVYDDFGFGFEEPTAVKRFFAAKRPSYGLLVGDATFDYRGILGLHSMPGVPPYESGYDLDPTVYAMNAVALDCWYADFDGAGFSPDMFLGRITARTPEEFAGWFRKLVKYETGERGFWCKRAILLADDEFEGDPGRPDAIGLDHVTYCETVSSIFGEKFEPTKIYLTEYALTSIKDKPGARADLIAALRRGALLFAFFGHGSGDNLTHENALTILSVPQLVNQGRSPFCFFGSCGVGRWEDTKAECIAEEMVRKPDGGAIASVGASKSTSSYGNLAFAQRMFTTLFANQDLPVGFAFAQAVPNGTLYHLFGDPATTLAFPDSGASVTLDRGVLQPGQFCRFGGSLPLRDGYVASELFGPKWLRTYYSPNPRARPRPVTYVLPGVDMFHGLSRVGENVYQGGFVVPTGIERKFRSANDGSYLEVVKSTRLSLAAWQGNRLHGVLHDTIELDTATVSSGDRVGPAISLFADDRRLSGQDTNVVPAEFMLTGRLTDTSGILVSRVPGGDGLYFYVDDFRNRVPVNQSFAYDLDSYTSGSFASPVTVGAGVDTIVVTAADNLLNRSTARVMVRAQDDSRPEIREPLVYPNPVRDGGWFTFRLSTAAAVSIRVFSLSGRPLQTIEKPDAVAGFNQVFWDGRDRNGSLLPNGVYLYSVTARVSGISSGRHQNTEAVARDRLLVRR
jgi:hypothetical protein